MDVGTKRLRGSVEEGLWPLVETFLGAHDVAGLAVPGRDVGDGLGLVNEENLLA